MLTDTERPWDRRSAKPEAVIVVVVYRRVLAGIYFGALVAFPLWTFVCSDRRLPRRLGDDVLAFPVE